MNIFYLANDTDSCARQHPDKHVVKMILETAQLLCTVHRVLDTLPEGGLMYKVTHQNHPCAKWVRISTGNYEWLFNLLVSLNDEYTYRYGKCHKVRREGLEQLLASFPSNLPEGGFTLPPQCMPEECQRKDTIEAYQIYYNDHKRHLLNWKFREIPSWVVPNAAHHLEA